LILVQTPEAVALGIETAVVVVVVVAVAVAAVAVAVAVAAVAAAAAATAPAKEDCKKVTVVRRQARLSSIIRMRMTTGRSDG